MSNGNPKFAPVLIFTIPGGACVIGNYGFMPSKVFSVYAEYENFQRDVAEVQQSFDNFITYLMDKDLGEYLEPDAVTDQVTNFLSWDLIPTAQDVGSAFDLIHKYPLALTQHLLEQLASGYRSLPFQEALFTRDEYFRFMAEKCTSVKAIEELRFTIALSQITVKENQLIKEHGFTTMNVFDNETGMNFSHTVALSGHAGFEVIVMAALDTGILHRLAIRVAESYTKDGPKIEEGIHVGWLKNQSGEDMRFELVEIVAGQVLGKLIKTTRGEVKRVMQVLIADKNNILPGESGYDTEGFKQPAFQQLRNIRVPQ
jgi:hypothetical protein